MRHLGGARSPSPVDRRADGSCVPRPTHELASCLELGAADANREHADKILSGTNKRNGQNNVPWGNSACCDDCAQRWPRALRSWLSTLFIAAAMPRAVARLRAASRWLIFVSLCASPSPARVGTGVGLQLYGLAPQGVEIVSTWIDRPQTSTAQSLPPLSGGNTVQLVSRTRRRPIFCFWFASRRRGNSAASWSAAAH